MQTCPKLQRTRAKLSFPSRGIHTGSRSCFKTSSTWFLYKGKAPLHVEKSLKSWAPFHLHTKSMWWHAKAYQRYCWVEPGHLSQYEIYVLFLTFNLFNSHTVAVVWRCRAAFVPDNTKWHLGAILWTAAVVQTSLSPSNHTANSGAGGWGCSFMLDKWGQTTERHKTDRGSPLIWWTVWLFVE